MREMWKIKISVLETASLCVIACRKKSYFREVVFGNVAYEVFDNLHNQGRMEYTVKPTPHSYPVFVV